MSDARAKPARTQRLEVEIEATPEAVWKALTEGRGIACWFAPEASTEGSGVGSAVTFAWSEQMRWTTHVDAWEPGKRVRWFDQGVMGDGTALACEFVIEALAGGKVRVTLVQSGFGENDGWDDFFAGTDVGWRYFLQNLRCYVERHAERTRHMISARLPVAIPRAQAWRTLLSDRGGLFAGDASKAQVGDRLTLRLGEATPAEVILAVEERAIALLLPALRDALLFLEFEAGDEGFHVGAWLSVYDAALAERLRSPATAALERAGSTVAAA